MLIYLFTTSYFVINILCKNVKKNQPSLVKKETKFTSRVTGTRSTYCTILEVWNMSKIAVSQFGKIPGEAMMINDVTAKSITSNYYKVQCNYEQLSFRGQLEKCVEINENFKFRCFWNLDIMMNTVKITIIGLLKHYSCEYHFLLRNNNNI